jgi:hypothetical protein
MQATRGTEILNHYAFFLLSMSPQFGAWFHDLAGSIDFGWYLSYFFIAVIKTPERMT